MTSSKTSALKASSLMIFVCLAALTGCCEKEQAQIQALNHQNELLMQDNKAFRDQITELDAFNTKLKDDNAAKDRQLATKDQEIADLMSRPTTNITEKDTTIVEGGWISTPWGDKVTVGSDVLFSAGRATLTNTGKQALNSIVRALRGTYSGLPVRVYGFTDSDPIRRSRKLWEDNLDLSANRAMAVTRYLVSQGVPQDNIETIGMGATHFVAGNKTNADKAKNRRVEIFVIKKK